jgi:methylenetetrahydrofolate reductase (NADPH)
MRDEGRLNSGREIAAPPRLFLGAADAPVDPEPGWEPDNLLGKIAAGADFVQTQYCFDLALLRRYVARLADHGIPEKVYLLVGIGPLASAKQARWMHENLWGVAIPEPIIKRLHGAADQKAEGRKICAELIQELATIPGVAGAHLMAPRQEAEMAAAIAESGIRKHRGERKAAAGA